MPDHVHLFCVPGTLPPIGIKPWVRYWKGVLTGILKADSDVAAQQELRPPETSAKIKWLSDCWDTQMRNYSHYVEKRTYVSRNPVRRGLVVTPEDWPYQGEVHVIRW